VTEVVNIQKVR